MFDKSIDRAGYISFIKVIAICSIFLFHYGRFRSLWGFIDEDEVYFFYRHASDVWEFVYRATGYGNIGVGIFIFASGFGLCLSYLKNKPSWGSFFKRRFIRIFPLYWLAIALQSCLNGFKGTTSTIVNLLGLQTFTVFYNDFSAIWFVSIIVIFYLLFPLLLRYIQGTFNSVALVLSTALVGVFFTDIINMLDIKYGGVNLFMYLPFFMLGIAFAKIHQNKPFKVESTWIRLSSVIALLALIFLAYTVGSNDERVQVVYYYFISITFACSLVIPYIVVRKFKPATVLVKLVEYGTYWFFMMHYAYIVYFTAFLARNNMIESIKITDDYHYYASDSQMYQWSIVIFITGIALSIFTQFVYDKAVNYFLYAGLHSNQRYRRNNG
jgi:peptidoglycan/LPS O-acetylase OafA/YrhL